MTELLGVELVNNWLLNSFKVMSNISPYASPVQDSFIDNEGGAVNPSTVEILRRTRGWVLLVGIVSLLGTSFMVLGVIIFMIAGAAGGFSDIPGAAASGISLVVSGIIVLVMSLIYILPAVRLIQYSTAIKKLVSSSSVQDLDRGLNAQRSFWKIVGLLVAIAMGLYALIFLVTVIGAIAGFSAIA